jgi:hypothetical protein
MQAFLVNVYARPLKQESARWLEAWNQTRQVHLERLQDLHRGRFAESKKEFSRLASNTLKSRDELEKTKHFLPLCFHGDLCVNYN